MDASLAASLKMYSDGDIIFAEFEKGNTFYLIQSGRVELVKQIGPLQKTLDVLHETEMFGEMALLEDTTRTATAIAMGTTQLMEFDKNNFQSLVLSNAQIAVKLLKMFVKRIYDAKRRFMILTLNDPNARVADVILMLDETNGDQDAPPDAKTKITLKTTLDSIARWAGLGERETNEAVRFFTKQGFLDVFPDTIVVKNMNYYQRLVNTARSKMGRN